MNIAPAQTEAARQACFEIRRSVFIEEQVIPEAEEWDAYDATCLHLLASDANGPAGTARVIFEGGTAKIGRVAVLQRVRGTGLGRRIMETAIDIARDQGARDAVLDAQIDAIAFYERLGFAAEGAEFDDGSGILHRRMHRLLPAQAKG